MRFAPPVAAIRFVSFAALVAGALTPSLAEAALLAGALSPNAKVRPTDTPTGAPAIALEAGRNEFESFQIVLGATGSDVAGVTAKLATPLTGPGGATIPAANVVLYAERYYKVAVASNDEGGAGLWPDPLVPAVDAYFGEARNAFPLTVPAGQSRVIWVDVLVPVDQAPGDYAGAISIDGGGAAGVSTSIALTLHVGTFTLPSTATLTSAFGMGWNTPPLVHCGGAFPYCGGDADKSNAIRALYLRAGLEHRFTILDSDFQPPASAGSDRALYEKHVLPLLNGTAATRLPGAKLTAVRLDGSDAQVGSWVAYAKSKGFFDRLVYYPVDEPGTDAATWTKFKASADALHAADLGARILITSSIQDANAAGASGKVDVFVPVIDQLENRPGSGYAGDQRAKYDAWLAADPKRRLWAYQSCDQHGCGACHATSPGVAYTGWPNRVIDSSAVQDRAFPWQAFRFRVTGELYFETTYQLATAWSDDGQCAFSGSGDGTLFYPGKPGVIGGTTDIPIESIRMKLIREGMEDYEYLTLVAAKHGDAAARAIADALFPHAYDSAKSAAQLEAARHQLFALLDAPATTGDAGPNDAGLGDASAGDAGQDAASGEILPQPGPSGCDCRAASARSSASASAGAGAGATALSVVVAVASRRRRRRGTSAPR